VTAARERLPTQHAFDELPNARMLASRRAFLRRVALYRRAWSKDRLYVFGVFERATGRHVGRVDLAILARWNIQAANLGYSILNQHWRRGYGKEATRAAVDIAFRELGLHRLEAGIDPGNRASIALAQSLGMQCEATRKRFYFEPPDGWVDTTCYVLTAEDVGRRPAPPRILPSFFTGV
jgi:RimJ/RimL family protein N-acetyltransferase